MTRDLQLDIIFSVLAEHGMLPDQADADYDTEAWNAAYAAIVQALDAEERQCRRTQTRTGDQR